MYGKVGRQSLSDGSNGPARIDETGSFVPASMGRYEEDALRGKLFFSYCAARATSVPATAQIGNIVYNPPDSGVTLVMLAWNAQIQVTSATTLGVTFGVSAQLTTPTGTTVADAYGSTLLNPPGFTKGQALAYAIATITTAPTPVFLMLHNTAAINTVGVDSIQGDFKGLFAVPPGNVVAMSAITAAVAASGMTSTLIWKEKDV